MSHTTRPLLAVASLALLAGAALALLAPALVSAQGVAAPAQEWQVPWGAAADPTGEMTLADDEIITSIELSAAARGGAQHWEKVMQRGAWDFALVSCAAVQRTDGAVRMSLGGVGLGPWRVALSVEEDVASGGLDEDSIDALAERAMYDAEPLARNGYKVDIARAVLRRAMRALGTRA